MYIVFYAFKDLFLLYKFMEKCLQIVLGKTIIIIILGNYECSVLIYCTGLLADADITILFVHSVFG